MPQNTLSAHLAILSRARLVSSERHSRSIVYRANLGEFRDVAVFLLRDCCGGRPEVCEPIVGDPAILLLAKTEGAKPCLTTSTTCLFLCTGNSARSVLAESILRKDGAGRFQAVLRRQHAKGAVHPLALRTLETMDYPADGMRSKSWLEFASADAPVMDFVFTVCDNAAGRILPDLAGAADDGALGH